MTWLRWDVKTPRHRVVGRLAEALGVRRAEALGLYFACCLGFGQYQTDGVAESAPDTSLEDWAMWQGKPGRFAAAFRVLCVADGGDEDDPSDVPGVLRGWWRQDALIRKRLKDNSRPPSHLRNLDQDFPKNSRAGTVRESEGETDGDGGRRTEDVDEKISSSLPPGLPGRLVKKLVGHPQRYAIIEFLDHLPADQKVAAWGLCISGCLEGLGLKASQPATIAEVAAACNDYRSTASGSWGIPHFRSFVDRVVAKRLRGSRASATGRSGSTERAVAAAKAFAEGGEP